MLVVVFVVFDKAPAVDINDVTFARSSKKIESANALTKCSRDLACHVSLLGAQGSDIPQLLAVGIASNNAVNDGRLSRLSVAEIGADCVCFHVFRVVNLHKAFIHVAVFWFADTARRVQVGNKIGALVANFAKQLSCTAARALWKVDDDIVVLCTGWFFDKWFPQYGTINAKSVVILNQFDGFRNRCFCWINWFKGNPGHFFYVFCDIWCQ